ncbi:hypothetical protein [Pollutibacter soli]|uniref:hypothetical protein n=1 Tax=Pollutibacter soli TaxID=3034157 RepID=UPI003013E62D
MIIRYIFYAFLVYLGYRFIVGFVIPVFKTTRQVKRQFRDIQERMQQQQHGGGYPEATPQQNTSQKNSSGNSKVGDYLDFEEVK